MHFQPEYYQAVVREVEKIVGRNIIQKGMDRLFNKKRYL